MADGGGAGSAASAAAVAAAAAAAAEAEAAEAPPRLVTLSSSGPLGVKAMAVPSDLVLRRFGCHAVVESIATCGALRRLGLRPPFGLAALNGEDISGLHQGDIVARAKAAVRAGPWTLVVAFPAGGENGAAPDFFDAEQPQDAPGAGVGAGAGAGAEADLAFPPSPVAQQQPQSPKTPQTPPVHAPSSPPPPMLPPPPYPPPPPPMLPPPLLPEAAPREAPPREAAPRVAAPLAAPPQALGAPLLAAVPPGGGRSRAAAAYARVLGNV